MTTSHYVGGRTAVGIRRPAPELAGHAHEELAPGIDHLCFRARSREDIDELYLSLAELGAELVRAPEEGPWAPGYHSLSFRDPEGIRLEVNHIPGKGVFADGASFTAARIIRSQGPASAVSGRRAAVRLPQRQRPIKMVYWQAFAARVTAGDRMSSNFGIT